MSELIIYQSDDGKAQVQFRAMDGSLWLSQLQLAELPQLLPYIRQIPLGRSVLKLRKQAQHWLHEHSSNGYLYALLAYLAQQEGETEQAELALHKARQYEPSLPW